VDGLIIGWLVFCVLLLPGFKEWKVDGAAVTRLQGELWLPHDH
jgi:hypothetical protein